MKDLPRRRRSLQFRFAAMLAVGLLVSLALSGFGLLLGSELLATVKANRHMTAVITRHDDEDARLRALRIAIGDLTREVEKGRPIAAARWRPLERTTIAGLATPLMAEPGLPPGRSGCPGL
ncbi:hypothetical protein SUS17_1494 [Sphingomonas sp. S17]|jgi:hypothetical protein|nr:hypothetical protein [Sphingomonas paucimobilis]EGI55694.1 hypothetical protein SUS17_1494 [Sphingomonas sp. S17]QPT10357.1 hypothetical protein I6G38_09265 [Sphingomonas paucimobilis]